MNTSGSKVEPSTCPFSIYYAGDAYSTSAKIMGRQSAGKAFMRGIARTWPSGTIYGVGPDIPSGKAMFSQLQKDGYAGNLKWGTLPELQLSSAIGSLYYPAPPAKSFAIARNLVSPAAFSILGVTHTLSSLNATDQVADLILPPFQPWDALICTSEAAKEFVVRLQDEMREYWRSTIGADKFVQVQLPVIPLGVDAPSFMRKESTKAAARVALGVQEGEVAFLFAGRLSFHAKANPAPVYQALERAAKSAKIVMIEAGVFPNQHIRDSYAAAQKALAPSVRFIWADGKDDQRYADAWQAADVFVSLSDNIQETYGLTPVEAMAAGLPVVVSEWNGYKDTVRHGIDGFQVPTILPPPGTGGDLALRHSLDVDTYDFYIGRASLATVVDPVALADRLTQLAQDRGLRRRMGASGAERAVQSFDWPVVLRQYEALSKELSQIRLASGTSQGIVPPPNRTDPFARFGHYPSRSLQGHWRVKALPDAEHHFLKLRSLSMLNYGFHDSLLNEEIIRQLLHVSLGREHSVDNLLLVTKSMNPAGVRALMWLWKFNLVQIAE